jgi:hypothetical protein
VASSDLGQYHRVGHSGQTTKSRQRLPGPLRRLQRDRARLVAILLLAIVALASSGIQSAAAVTLQQTLNANWRGAYDILVTGKKTDVGTGGFLAPNSLSFGDRGMTLAELAQVDKVSGVEVAAPIGEVVAPLKAASPSVSLPDGAVDATSTPQAFRLVTKYSTNDGISERYVASETSYLIVDDTPKEPSPTPPSCQIEGVDVDVAKYPLLCPSMLPEEYRYATISDASFTGWGGGGIAENGVFHLYPSVHAQPSGSTRITLVDPVAEAALLGKRGSFLKPLEKIRPTAKTSIDAMNSWAHSTTNQFSSEFLSQQELQDSMTGGSKASREQFDAFLKDNGLHAPKADPSIYVPLLTAKDATAPLTFSIEIQALGAAPRVGAADAATQFPYRVPAKAQGTEVGSASVDASPLLNPFVRAPVELPWPGTPTVSPPEHDSFAMLPIRAAGTVSAPTATLKKAAKRSVAATLEVSGYAQPIPDDTAEVPNPFLLLPDGDTPGLESAYSKIGNIPQKRDSPFKVGVTVGEFSTTQLDSLQSSLSYVPLGAYQPVGATARSGSSTYKLKPSISGLGLVSSKTAAIASIYSAAAWGQTAPVSAIRVKVSGLSGYDTAGQRRVLGVASAIRDLGLTATIVAGSSPADVAVAAGGYAFGVPENRGQQKVATLDGITQRWSELGAAARADAAVSTSSLSILGISLGSTALLLGAVQFASVPRRRSRAAVMREIGWTGGQIRRWMSAEEVPAVLVVLAAGIGAILLSGATQVSITIASIGVAAVVATSAIAIVAGSKTRTRRAATARATHGRRSLVLRTRSIAAFGLNQVRVHTLTAVILLIAILVVGVSAAGLLEIFQTGRSSAGTSLLAQFSTGQAALPQIALGVTGVLAGVVLAIIIRRIDLARRAPQWAALRAMGWTSPEVRSAQRTEAIAIAVPAVLITAAAVWFGSLALAASSPLLLTVVGTVAALVVAIAVLFFQRKAARS